VRATREHGCRRPSARQRRGGAGFDRERSASSNAVAAMAADHTVLRAESNGGAARLAARVGIADQSHYGSDAADSSAGGISSSTNGSPSAPFVSIRSVDRGIASRQFDACPMRAQDRGPTHRFGQDRA